MARMLVVVAHPDDETFGTGSVIAAAAAAGVDVHVCCATRGEAGEDTSGTTGSPGELAAAREAELHTAAAVLGASGATVLGFADSDMEGAPPPDSLVAVPIDDVIAAVAARITALAPDVVVTLDPVSINDHRDHMRIGEATTHAFARAAPASSRLYYWTLKRSLMVRWQAEMKARGALPGYVDLELGRPDDEITTVIDAEHLLDVRRAGIAAHRTQTSPFASVSSDLERELLVESHLVRVVPAWPGGPLETSLFDGAGG
ncbi:MAG TPA: PIG-L deacetylase family protein [Acidimicrobiia bacterium]|nr:PIG-L deacetylase family protein [Acidimicrobiia bacterium]